MPRLNLRQQLRRAYAQWVRPVLPVVLIICAVRSSLADYYHVPTGSMKPTILEGDRVFVNKLAYDLKIPFTGISLLRTAEPQRGDIVVFDQPGQSYPMVKRVIGIPGDTVALRDNHVYLNGQKLDYDALGISAADAHDPAAMLFREALPGHDHPIMVTPHKASRRWFGPVTLGPDELLVLGDNRDNSLDSRYFGVVRRSDLRGQAIGNVFSLDPDTWKPRPDRFATPLR